MAPPIQFGLGLSLARAGGAALDADGLSLDLQFAADKTLTARKGPTPVFTRASTATFVGSDGLIQSAAIDATRFDHDPLTLACKGLLIEEQRDNLISHSEAIDNISWNSFSTATGANVANTTPSGSATSTRLTAVASASAASRQRVRVLILASGASDRTSSCFIKAGTSDFGFVNLGFNKVGVGGIRSCTAHIVFSTGVVTKTGVSNEDFNVVVTSFANGWYRISISGKSNVSLAVEDQVVIGVGISFDGAGGSGEFFGTETIFAWGAQLEAGAFPTSYIPTTTAALTRSADVCSITGSDFSGFYNQSEGTMLANAFTPASGDRSVLAADDNTANEMIRLRTEGTNPFFKVTDGGSDVVAIDAGTVTENTAFKLIGAYKVNDFASSINGGSAVTDTTGTIPTVDRMRIGAGQGGNTMCGCISAIRYFKKRLPDAKLQTLTS
jgi:hypothetical protein